MVRFTLFRDQWLQATCNFPRAPARSLDRAGPAFPLFPLLAGGDQGFGGVGVGGGEDLRLFLLRLLRFLVATRLVALGHFNDFFCVPEAGPAGWLGAVAAEGRGGAGSVRRGVRSILLICAFGPATTRC